MSLLPSATNVRYGDTVTDDSGVGEPTVIISSPFRNPLYKGLWRGETEREGGGGGEGERECD